MNDVSHGGIAADQLRSIIERIERLEEEKAATASDIKEVYAEAKANGFSTPTNSPGREIEETGPGRAPGAGRAPRPLPARIGNRAMKDRAKGSFRRRPQPKPIADQPYPVERAAAATRMTADEFAMVKGLLAVADLPGPQKAFATYLAGMPPEQKMGAGDAQYLRVLCARYKVETTKAIEAPAKKGAGK